jgi:hypothetical protein
MEASGRGGHLQSLARSPFDRRRHFRLLCSPGRRWATGSGVRAASRQIQRGIGDENGNDDRKENEPGIVSAHHGRKPPLPKADLATAMDIGRAALRLRVFAAKRGRCPRGDRTFLGLRRLPRYTGLLGASLSLHRLERHLMQAHRFLEPTGEEKGPFGELPNGPRLTSYFW